MIVREMKAEVAVYMRPSPDGSSPARLEFWTHDVEKFHNFPKYEMMTLMLHEAEPGHHFEVH